MSLGISSDFTIPSTLGTVFSMMFALWILRLDPSENRHQGETSVHTDTYVNNIFQHISEQHISEAITLTLIWCSYKVGDLK